jgi:hypothetical protein
MAAGPGRPTQRQQTPIRDFRLNLPREELSLGGIGPCWVRSRPESRGQQRGQERTQDVGCNRRSLDLQFLDLRRGRQARWSSSLLTQLPRALRALPTWGMSPRTGLTLRTSWEPSLLGESIVVLAGCVTHANGSV